MLNAIILTAGAPRGRTSTVKQFLFNLDRYNSSAHDAIVDNRQPPGHDGTISSFPEGIENSRIFMQKLISQLNVIQKKMLPWFLQGFSDVDCIKEIANGPASPSSRKRQVNRSRHAISAIARNIMRELATDGKRPSPDLLSEEDLKLLNHCMEILFAEKHQITPNRHGKRIDASYKFLQQEHIRSLPEEQQMLALKGYFKLLVGFLAEVEKPYFVTWATRKAEDGPRCLGCSRDLVRLRYGKISQKANSLIGQAQDVPADAAMNPDDLALVNHAMMLLDPEHAHLYRDANSPELAVWRKAMRRQNKSGSAERGV